MAEVALRKVAQNLCNLLPKWWEISDGCIPGDLEVDPQIIVGQLVAHSCNSTPWHARVLLTQLDWKIFHLLADNLEAPKDGVLLQRVV